MKRSGKSRRRKGRLLAIYFAATMVALVAMVASRAAYYALPLPPGVESELGELMRSYVIGFNGLMGTIPLQALAILVLLLALAVRPRLFWTREEGGPRALRPWVYAAAGSFAVLNHHLFDADPLVAKLCWTGLGLLALGTVSFGGSPPGRLAPAPRSRRRRPRFRGDARRLSDPGRHRRDPLLGRLARRHGLGGGPLLPAEGRAPPGAPHGAGRELPRPLGARPVRAGASRGKRHRARGARLRLRLLRAPRARQALHDHPDGAYGGSGEPAGRLHRRLRQRRPHAARRVLPLRRRVLRGAPDGLLSRRRRADHDERRQDRGRARLRQRARARRPGSVAFSDVDLRRGDPPRAGHGSPRPRRRLRSGDGRALLRERVDECRLPPRRGDGDDRHARRRRPSAEGAPALRDLRPPDDAGSGPPHPPHPPSLGVARRVEHLRAPPRPPPAPACARSSRHGSVRRLRGRGERPSHRLGSLGHQRLRSRDGRDRRPPPDGPGGAHRRHRPGADLIYVPTTYGGHMWVFDRDSLEPLGRVTTGVGGRPAYLTLDGRSLFASAGSKTYRWDAEDLGRRFGRPR